ncbi:MAG: hypothetical protein AAGI30_09195 [Planctomycetota bacterium]
MNREAMIVGAVVASALSGQALAIDVIGGQTSVLLDTGLLSSAAGLDLSGVSPGVGAGELGDGSVAFSINSRTFAPLPTTFTYTDGLATFGGTIEHLGSVFFNADAVEVGNFTIGFDQSRADSGLSGFFVASTTGVAATLFDIVPTVDQADAGGLVISGDLLVSAEFASFLGDDGLAGADVGDALVNAVVPTPATAGLALVGGAVCGRRRR